jgi:hypothetical protein
VLTLTNGNGGEARSAWFNTAVPIGSFTTSFTYDGTTNGADGVAFVLQNAPTGTAALGESGGSLGYAGGISTSAAFEINIYNGHTQGTNFVTDDTAGNYDPTGSVNVASGDPINVVLIYNAAAGTFTEKLTDTTNPSETYTQTFTGVNLETLLGAPTALLGFTGGDGAGTSTQTISNFRFTLTSGIFAGQTINLSAGGSVGAADPLPADTTIGTQGVLDVSARTGVYLVATSGDLNVGQVSSAQGNIVLTAIGPVDPAQDLILGSSSVVSAPQGDVTLQASGDVTLAPGSVVDGLTVSIESCTPDPTPAATQQAQAEEAPAAVASGADPQITLAGTINAQTISVLGGGGDDRLTVYQTGLNGNLQFDGGDGQNSLIVQGADNNNQFLVDGATIVLNGTHTITTSQVQETDIHGGAGSTSFEVVSTLAGTHTSLFGGEGANRFWIGSDGTTGNGSLDRIQGAVQVTGGGNSGGANELDIDDRGARNAQGRWLSAGYIITPGQLVSDPASGLPSRSSFAGITYDGPVGTLHLFGSQGANDVFLVKPSQSTEYILNGRLQGGGSRKTGDILMVDVPGSTRSKLKKTASGAGIWSFAGQNQNVQFSGIGLSQHVTLGATAGGSPVTRATRSGATFTVDYRGFTALDRAGLLSSSGAIQVQGPHGYSQSASLLALESSSDGNSQIATYTVPAPGGAWGREDNGVYRIKIVPGSIKDSLGDALPGGVAGRFRVKINKINPFGIASPKTASSRGVRAPEQLSARGVDMYLEELGKVAKEGSRSKSPLFKR